MSKTSEENSIPTTARAIWKQCVASVIGFAHRYRHDFFLRTEINVIALQAAFAFLIGALAIGSLVILYHDIVSGIASAIATALTSPNQPLTPELLMAQLEAARTREIVGLSGLIICATAIFGYLASRVALIPARKALDAQKQFIGNIAHELRTPLAIIKTNTEVRMLEPDIPEEAREAHLSNLEELDRISDTINNLLSLNALFEPERVSFTDVDLAKTADRVIGKLGSLIKQRPVRVRVKAAQERLARGSAAGIEQIAMNLIKNAVYYTNKGDITVYITPVPPNAIEFSVEDAGIGISREDLLHIFEPFYRGDRARTRNDTTGSGLGLSIVAELVKMHKGSIRIKSAPGKGTTVTVSLPAGTEEEIPPTTSKEVAPPDTDMPEVVVSYSGVVRSYKTKNS